MTTAQAINKAMQVFNKDKKVKGNIRTVALWEGTGSGDRWQDLRIHIGYAVDGDYTESDANPYVVSVWERDGKIYGETRN